jgi:alanine racemase
MQGYQLSEIAHIMHGEFKGSSHVVKELFFDSRRTFDVDVCMFIAIDGERHNGHHYIEGLYQKGVRNFLISEFKEEYNSFSGAGFIIVANTIHALQQFAAFHRKKYKIPVVGITGSNGKTIVKEWLSIGLSAEYKTTRSPKSYNSQIGVPISVIYLNNDTEYAVFEAGISFPDEMQNLQEIILPTHGIITNIGDAHQLNFNTLEQKLDEKLKLFKYSDRIYYCRDHEIIHKRIQSNILLKGKEVFNWSAIGQEASVQFSVISITDKFVELQYLFKGQQNKIRIPFTDRASLENMMHVITYLVSVGYTVAQIQSRVEQMHPIAMRMEQIKAINNCLLVNDAYNADINALGLALDVLNQQPKKKKILILSDISQSGTDNHTLYSQVVRLLRQSGVDKFIGVGETLVANKYLFEAVNSEFYVSTNEFIERLKWEHFEDSIILLKGSRSFRFEKIAAVLTEKNHTTSLEINLSKLTENLNHFRSLISDETRIMVMVKALAYGSGGFEVANLLQHEKVDYLGVAFADEGVQLRQSGITLPIMVMAPVAEDFSRVIEYELEPEIYNFRILKQFIDVAESLQVQNYPVHIKIDTGMHRLGFLEHEIKELASIIKSTNTIRVKAIFSHLAASDDKEEDAFTHYQITLFQKIYDLLSDELGYHPMRHLLNSAGIERFPSAHFDMVRLGIGLHGISAKNAKLSVVSQLKTHIAQIKTIPPGDTIGYGRRGRVGDNQKIAIIPIGYADGLDRKLGNRNGYVLIHGKKAPFVGSICMDMSMIDIHGIKCSEGDEVVVFGEVPHINELAEQIGTIPYEVLTNVSSRVKRIFYKD